MSTEQYRGFSSYAAAWLVAAAFGFSIYVVGMVFYGEDLAWLIGIGAFLVIGAALSYIYVVLPHRLHERIAQEERKAQKKLEEDKAAALEAQEPEPDFDWDDETVLEEETDEDEARDVDESAAEGTQEGVFEDDGDETSQDTSDENAGKPTGYSSPEGEADDLKKIKGIGPKLEEMLNGMGFYHYSQIAEWGDKEIAWMDDNLEGFRGRVTRDEWVAQAQDLLESNDEA